MTEFFKEGGWGMYPTALFGLLLVASSVLFFLRHDQRQVTVMVALGVLTLGTGLLSFCTGLMSSFSYLRNLHPDDVLPIAAQGVCESLHNLVLALELIILASIIAAVAAFKAPRGAT